MRKRHPVGESWLSQEIEAIRRTQEARRPWHTYGQIVRNLAFPSWKTTAIAGIFLLVSVFLSWLITLLPTYRIIHDLLDIYTAMWQVQAGIAVIALPFLLFVIELARDEKQAAARSHEVLIWETRILPTILLSLAGTIRTGIDIIWFFTPSVFFTDFLVFILTATFAAVAYVRALTLIFSPSRMEAAALRVVREKVRASLDDSIRIRLGNKLLFSKLEELGVDFWPFGHARQEAEEYLVIKIRQSGTLHDVHLRNLEALLRELPWKTTVRAASVTSVAPTPGQDERRPEEHAKEPSLWLMKRYGDPITLESSGFLRLRRAAFSVLIPEEMDKSVARITRVAEPREQPRQDLRRELGHLRDNLVDNVKRGIRGQVGEGLGIYRELVQAFLDKIKIWKSPYDKQRALAELSSLEGGWVEVEWVRDDLQDVIDATAGASDIHLIGDIFHFPIELAGHAFAEEDYYTFHQFISWIPYCYARSLDFKEQRIRDFAVDRCWRYLKEFADFIVARDIEEASSEAEVSRKGEFAYGVVSIFNQLLKKAYDKGQRQHFETFAQKLSSDFDHDQLRAIDHAVDSIQLRLEDLTLGVEARRRLRAELTILAARRTHLSGLAGMKRVAYLGLDAWALHHYNSDKLDSASFLSFHRALTLSGEPSMAWRDLTKATDHRMEREFRWDWWVIEEHPEGAVVKIDFNHYLYFAFCIRMLEHFRTFQPAERNRLELPQLGETLYLAEGADSPLRQILTRIQNEARRFEPIIGPDGIAAIPDFETLLDRAVQSERRRRVAAVIGAEMSQTRLDGIKKDILLQWEEHAVARRIFKSHRCYQYSAIESATTSFYGFNVLDSKRFYLDDPPIIVPGLGTLYGRGLANIESDVAFGSLISGLPARAENPLAGAELTGAIDAAVNELSAHGYSPVIIVLNSWTAEQTVAGAEAFRNGRYFRPGSEPIGHYRNRPVFKLHHRGESMVLVVDLSRSATWRQFKPRQVLAGEQYWTDELSFYISAYSADAARELLVEQPRFGRDEAGNSMPEDQALNEIQQRVHFRLVEQFEVEVVDQRGGFKLTVAD